MSANAASLRRILRSIGSHATPATSSSKKAHVTPTSHLDTYHRHSSTASPSPRVRRHAARTPTATATTAGNVPLKPTVYQENEEKPVVKEGLTFPKQYFDAHKSDDKHRMKQRARRHLLSKQRSEISEKQAWREILRILEQHSPGDAEYYIKRMETIRLPEGIFAQWIRDPGDSILEVMQRTGSHVQVKPTKEIGHFSSITLLGTPSQNAAAKKLLQESDLLSAVSEDDLNASKSLADYHLRSEVGGPRERKNWAVDDTRPDDNQLHDHLDALDMSALEDAISITTGQDQTRAVWSKPTTTPLGESFKVKSPKGHTVIGTAKSATPPSATAFTAHIDGLTADRPRKLWTMDRRRNPHVQGQPIQDELVSLLTNPDNAHVITPVAARIALRYLAKHMFFPAIRDILNALKDANSHLDAELLNADLFNVLLDAAAQHENVVAFHYLINMMRERSVCPNAGTWIAFHTLMLKRYPGDSHKVLQKMRAKSVQTVPSVAIENIEAYASQLLLSFSRERPKASIRKFIENMNRDVQGVKWLTAFSANTMCHTLLKLGRISRAFELVDELIRGGGRPDVVTLNTFLTAANKGGHLPLAIVILRKFHDLHNHSIALASTKKNPTTVLPRPHDLSITPNGITFQLLFDLAWSTKYPNCARVFWRYACCAGHVDSTSAQLMKRSAESHSAKEGFVQTTDTQLSPRAAMWQAWGAKFAMGVKAGLGPSHAADVLSVVSHPVVDAPKDSPPNSPEQLALRQARNKATRNRVALIAADQAEVQSLKPVRSFAEIAVEAWKLDKKWRETVFGLPKGLRRYGDGDTMFEMMLKEGIEVPVEVGDGVGLTL
ncbi:hypothetical protein Q7P35_002910 [Cladosporium inversicolor]